MSKSNGDGGGEENNPNFKWGIKKETGRINTKVQFYESFTFDGIEYKLFDCAYFLIDNQCETSIGKLVRMFENSKGEKKVKVVWFLRPIDIKCFLGDYDPYWDELFLACGDEKGVYNINDVHAIMGKCNVVCISKDPRNPRPRKSEMRMTNYTFSCTFDTKRRLISEDFAFDAIAGIKVENFFNKVRDKQPPKRLDSSAAPSFKAPPMKSLHPESMSAKLGNSRDGKLMSRISSSKKGFPLKDRADNVSVEKDPTVNTDITSRVLKTKTRALGESHASGSSVSKKRKLILNTPESDDEVPRPEEKRVIKNPPLEEKASSQNIDKCSWYKKLPFREELQAAIKKGRVLFIENLEPSYTSLDVEDLFRQAFKERVDARMIPASPLSIPHNGRALVIFATTRAADSAMSQLTEQCLMLSDHRPVVASRNVPVKIEKCTSFNGHFSLVDKSLMSTHKRNAVSTSHCAQPNHVVDNMGLQWKAFQDHSKLKMKKLFEEQAKEINMIKTKTIRKPEDRRTKMQDHLSDSV